MNPADTVARTFPLALREVAVRHLYRYGMEPHEKEVDRVRLAAVRLSHGNLDRLERFIDATKKDYRDVLMWAEQEGKE